MKCTPRWSKLYQPPSRAPLREALEEGPAVVDQHVVLAGHVVRLQPGAADELLGRVELRGAREMADIAGVDQQLRAVAPLPHQLDRLAERAGRVGVRRVVEADMAVADLHEGEVAGRLRRGRLRAGQHGRAGHPARHGPEHAAAGPQHAGQRAAAIDRVPHVVLLGLVDMEEDGAGPRFIRGGCRPRRME